MYFIDEKAEDVTERTRVLYALINNLFECTHYHIILLLFNIIPGTTCQ